MIREASLLLPHPIVFIYDPSRDSIEVPKNYAEDLVAASKSCISVWAQASVDGPVTIRLSDEPSRDLSLHNKVFSGFVETPGREIAVLTSEAKPILSLKAPMEKMKVCIWVRDSSSPEEIVVEVHNENRPE